jgi:hypothetical protein
MATVFIESGYATELELKSQRPAQELSASPPF